MMRIIHIARGQRPDTQRQADCQIRTLFQHIILVQTFGFQNLVFTKKKCYFASKF